jgi:hypothetical protein
LLQHTTLTLLTAGCWVAKGANFPTFIANAQASCTATFLAMQLVSWKM